MNNVKMVILIIVFFCSAIFVFAQSNNSSDVPVGMEKISVGGGGQMIVPKGAKIKQVGAQVVVEDANEYMSRMVYEMDLRMKKIEESQEEIKNIVDTLNQNLEQMQKKLDSLGADVLKLSPESQK